jgi:hypothetical protein
MEEGRKDIKGKMIITCAMASWHPEFRQVWPIVLSFWLEIKSLLTFQLTFAFMSDSCANAFIYPYMHSMSIMIALSLSTWTVYYTFNNSSSATLINIHLLAKDCHRIIITVIKQYIT